MPKMTLKGKVLRNKMQNTVVVGVSRVKVHPKYGKRIHVTKKYYAHADEPIDEGVEVVIQENKPISKTKRWKVIEVLNNKE